MNSLQCLLLGILLTLFFGTNYYIYNYSFDMSKDKMKASIVDMTKQDVVQKNYPSVLNFGDVMFDRGVRNIIENRGRDPFEYIKRDFDFIDKFDIIIANLEGPIVEMDRNECQQKAYNFQFASTTPELLKTIGINMVNIANNHSRDCFSVGYESTKQYLKQFGISYIGDQELEESYRLVMVNDKRMAFVGIDQTISPALTDKAYALIKKLDSENDYIVVNIHWGEEYKLEANSTQIDIAHKLIDNGADVIFGHHPHVVEPMEIYKGKMVFYSLGNFVFDQNFGDTTVGLGVGVEFQDSKSVYTLFPFNIKVFAPEFMVGDERTVFCEKYLKSLNPAGCSFEITPIS
ncbi:MAG: CapA family protein [Candidatus Paceibacterota bacterium]